MMSHVKGKSGCNTVIVILHTRYLSNGGGGLAQWLGCRISDQGVPGSSPGRCTVCCGLEQVTFTPCLVLVKPRNRWTDDRLGQTVTRLETTLCLMCSVQGT